MLDSDLAAHLEDYFRCGAAQEDMMTFNANDHTITMERKAKKKDAQGHETWEVTKTEYLPVQWRLCWFRLDNPTGKIDSKSLILDLDRGAAVFETYVEREDGGSARMHGSETAGDWKDYIEKAQTKSLGRALAAVGYGSQFTDEEFDEGERIVDAPVQRKASEKPATVSTSNHPTQSIQATSRPSQTVTTTKQPFRKEVVEVYRLGLKSGAWKSDVEFYTALSVVTGKNINAFSVNGVPDETLAEMLAQPA